MSCAEDYITLKGPGRAELTEKRSRFIGVCAPVGSEAEALSFVEGVRQQERAASHHVWAYYLKDQNLCRYTDDGEPSGTAGLPVLDVLRRGEIRNAVVVVTRYFGGTLLGTGGLVRAYSAAASQAVAAAGRARMTWCCSLSLSCAYGDYDRIARLLEERGALVLDTAFADVVRLAVRVPAPKKDALCAALRESTRGGCEPTVTEEGFFPVDAGTE